MTWYCLTYFYSMFSFQVDVWALGVSAIEMAEVYIIIWCTNLSRISVKILWFFICQVYSVSQEVFPFFLDCQVYVSVEMCFPAQVSGFRDLVQHTQVIAKTIQKQGQNCDEMLLHLTYWIRIKNCEPSLWFRIQTNSKH